MKMLPPDKVSSPATRLSKVDLPQPEGPTSTTNSPSLNSMSTPLMTSVVPKFFHTCSSRTLLIALAFQCSGGESADEIFPGDDIDQQGGQGGKDRSRHVDIVFLHARRGVDDVIEGDGYRIAVADREGDAEQEIVPDLGELPDHGHDNCRRRHRQQNAEEDAEEARAIDLRRLNDAI